MSASAWVIALSGAACSASALQVDCAASRLATCPSRALNDLAAEACAELGRALPGQRIGDATLQAVQSCGAPVASARSALGQAAAVPAYLEVRDGPPSHGAFLFVHTGDGWRLMDAVLEPAWTHGGQCDARFALRWAGATAAPRLRVMAERTCHVPLDAAERSSGTSSVASRECRTLRYGTGEAGLRRLGAGTADGRCSFR